MYAYVRNQDRPHYCFDRGLMFSHYGRPNGPVLYRHLRHVRAGHARSKQPLHDRHYLRSSPHTPT